MPDQRACFCASHDTRPKTGLQWQGAAAVGLSYLPFAVALCPSLLAFRFCPAPFNACLLLLPLAVLPFAAFNTTCLIGYGRYYKAAKLAEALQSEHHYTVDEKQKSVLLTEQGYEDAEDVLEVWVVLGPVRLHSLSPAGSASRRALL